MSRFARASAAVLLAFFLLPAAAFAQGAITGVVKDASGAVLPGVTVEAASPALIEKVRSVVSDDTGQYRIVDLRPGTYSVTFTLPGFSTVKREGIELSGNFVATVNGDLKVGALEETITVTGETPVVDVQTAKVQQTMSKDVIAAVPTSRNVNGIQALIPGMSGGGDSGGITGGTGGMAGAIHGGAASDSRTYSDGINIGWAGANANAAVSNVAGAQEVAISTSGGLGEAETAGVVLNVIPREGGNTFSGQFNVNGANDKMQGSNYTDSLKTQGLKTPSELLKVYDINPMGGGRIVRDRLWFYLTYRENYAENTVPGMWFNKNAGNPNAWNVDFDLSQTAFSDSILRNAIGRITWQVSPRNKINLHWSEQYTSNSRKGGGSGTTTPEASGLNLYRPAHVQQATWSSPYTSKMLLEAGWAMYQARYANTAPRLDGTNPPTMIQVVDQGTSPGTGIPGLTYRMPFGLSGGFQHHLIGTLANLRASMSYVTGAHSLKIGYQGGFNNPSQTYYNFTGTPRYRFRDGVPNQLLETAASPNSVKVVRNLVPTSFFAQDQWTSGKLTLQGGVRYDHILTSYPESSVGGPGYTLMPQQLTYPSRSTEGVHWSDVTPRIGAAYDLLGNGKTAVKVNLGKYVQAFTATNTDMDLNPLIRGTVSTTRTWTDTNKDFVPNCDLINSAKNSECGAMDNQNFGTNVFTRFYDSDLINGWGKRGYNWELGVSVQQEVAPRVAATVGYFRRWFGNFYTVDNRATLPSDYTSFSIPIPVDSRLPGGGGGTVSGLYNLISSKVGAVDELAELSSVFGKQIQNWQGVDFSINARLRNGITVQGGTSTGRTLLDNCDIRAVLPETYGSSSNNFTTTPGVVNPYCHVVEPYTTSLRGLATYTVPKVGVQVSGTWRSDPGNALLANYTVTNAIAFPSLQRNLSSGNVTVNLVTPNTLFGARQNNLDLRLAKVLRYGRTRTQVGVDIYNVTNTDVVTTYNQTFVTGGAWLTPTGIQPARYVKINAQMDF
jgi:hypothetical protein